MRLAPALTLLVLLAACGGDAPEPAIDEPPAEQESVGSRPEPSEQPEPEPTPPSTAAEPTERSEPTADRSLYTVQVAAFTSAVSARELATGLRGDALPVWTSIVEVDGRTFHRVRLGAVPSVTAAYRLGDLLTARYGWPVWVAPVTPADRIPPDAVQRTREQLRIQGG